MKTTRKHLPFYLFLLVLVWKSSSLVQAQSDTTYTGSITVTTQAEVDTLRNTLAGKTIIDGNLTIGHSFYPSDITDLTPLGSIVRIMGEFSVAFNNKLTDLGDFPVLQSIGGNFSVAHNDSLTDLGDFPVLQSIGGNFSVAHNDSLTDLGDFPVLQSIGGGFGVNRNSKLTNLGDFPVLDSIGGDFLVSINTDLTNLGDFPVLQTIGGGFLVSINSKLTNLGDFPVLQTIGSFGVIRNSKLTDLGDFPVLDSIGGEFSVTFNNKLTDLGDFPVLQSIGRNFRVSRNSKLTDLGDFPVLQTIGGSFSVGTNTKLTDLGDFPVLDSIGETFLVYGNSKLTDLGDFTVLETIGGGFQVSTNIDLTDLGDFTVLETIGGGFYVYENSKLTDLGDFPVLQSIGGGFSVRDNIELTDLGDFPNLTSIGVATAYVPSKGERTDSVSIVVENNSSLSDCYTLVEFLPGGATAVSGEISINNNALGCSSGGEIMASAPHTIMLTSHTEGDSIAIAYDEVTTQTIMFSIGGGATGWTSDITGDDFITMDTTMNVADTGVVITVRATPTKNTGVERSAVITFTTTGGTGATASATVMIMQSAALPTLTLAYSNVDTLAHDDGSTSVIEFSVANATWTVESSETFVTLDPTSGNAGDNLTVTATAEANAGAERMATITITATDGTTTLDTMVTLTQAGSPPQIQDTTYTGNIVVRTQAEVNALNTTLAGKTRINGNVTIGYTGFGLGSSRSDITDLTPLSNMSHITGNLRIERNRSLDSLTDLNTLQSIGGYFNVGSNDDLTDLGDFPALQSIGRYFDVSGNSALTDLGDFPVLQTIGGDFSVAENHRLTGVRDFPVLQTIGGYFSVRDNIELTTLGDFPVLDSIGGFSVQYNNVLTDLGDFPVLQSIGEGFNVWNNSKLTDVRDFPVLQSIGRGFNVSENDSLTALGDFPVLQSIGGVFWVRNNTKLTDLGDFPVLKSIGGDFWVRNNTKLTDLGDFPVLDSIGGYFRVWDNTKLTDLGDFPVLQTIGEYFSVNRNDSLTSLGNFSALQSIGEHFSVFNSAKLTTLGDFSVLQTIGGYFYVERNRELTDLGDFPSLTSIGVEEVYVPSEDRTIDSVSIVVENNSRLYDCYTLTDFLPGGSHAVSGMKYINNNAFGCNSGDEIMASAPHTIMLTSHTEGDSIAIAYNEVSAQTIMFSIGGGATGWTSDITGDDFITLDTTMNVADTGVVITVRATSTKNTGVERSAAITFTTTGGTGAAASATITITQEAPPPVLIRRVTTAGAGNRSGSSWANASQLQAALAASTTPGDQVWMAAGTYKPHATDRTATFTIPAGVGLYGGFAGNEATLANRAGGATILSGDLIGDDIARPATGDRTAYYATRDDNSLRVVESAGANVTLDGLTITAGQSGDGAGLYSAFANMTVVACTFSNNEGRTGAGARFAGTATLTSCVFTGNTAAAGGGATFAGTATLTNCVVVGNSATGGNAGGLSFSAGGTVINSTFYNNTATERGGGIVASFVDIDTDMTGVQTNPFNLQNSILIDNTATTAGNAIYLVDSEAPLNATDIESVMDYNLIGGGMTDLGFGLLNTSDTTYTAVAIANATNVAITNMIEESDAAVVFASTNAENDDFLRLRDGSPAINAGNDAYATESTDAAGEMRIQSGTVDLGAYESALATPIPTLPPQTSSTHTGDISITTQAQMDTIRNSLTAGVTRIVGNITIGSASGTSNITDLSPLAAIIEITGNVVIQRNPRLTNLMGVTQLQSIGGNLQFSINVNLQTLGSFSALQSIGGAFIVEGNDDLLSLGGFTSLTSIGSADGIFVPSTGSNQDGVSIVVEENDALLNCCVLTTFLSGAANAVSGGVFIRGNATGCSSITQVNCDPLLQVDQTVAFVAKTATESTLRVTSTRRWQLSKPNTGADWITNIAADGGNSDASSITEESHAFITTITITTTANPSNAGRSTTFTLTAIDMAGNPLTNPAPVTILFTQLGGFTRTGDVRFRSQAEVNAFSSNVTAIQGSLIIDGDGGSDYITDLGPLSGITHVTGDVSVGSNSNSRLVSLGPLGNLQSIGGNFSVFSSYNSSLTSLGDFSALQSIGGSFVVSRNRFLTSLGDFSALQSIGGSFMVGKREFSIYGNDVLTSLGDFSALQSIGGSFVVSRNRSLTSLGDFSALQSIGSFVVSRNDALTSLGGFPMLTSIISIRIERNDLLQDCCVLTKFLSGAENAVSGQIFIGNNAPGCSSTTQVNCDDFLQVDQKVVFATKTAGESTFEIFARQPWQLNKPNTGAEWITNIAADGGDSDASSITGENYASIAITTTANPSDAGRSTTLTLRAIDQTGNALTDPAPVTILFTQLGTTRTGSIKLSFQTEVNAIILPTNATAIQGDLIITTNSSGGSSNIMDLRRLSGITHVTGNVVVRDNSRLVSLGLLGNLQSIGGRFEVSSNRSLTSLGDFTALQAIGGRFEVRDNNAIDSLGDFSALQSIGGRFEVSSNRSLTSLGDFTALQAIGGSFSVAGSDDLTSLGDFTTLQSIGGDFEMRGLTSTSLGNFTALQSIGGSFEMRGNNRLDSLGTFPPYNPSGAILRWRTTTTSLPWGTLPPYNLSGAILRWEISKTG